MKTSIRKTIGKKTDRKSGRQHRMRPSPAAGGGTARERDEEQTGRQSAGNDIAALHREVSTGFAYLHNRMNATAGRAFDAASFIYALIELLEEKNQVSRQEIEERKNTISARLLNKFKKHDGGVAVQESSGDKYDSQRTANIDCESRVALCRAMCCKMVFPLSPQDLAEGIIAWDFGAPYVIAKNEDGYCRHFDRRRMGCTEHACRPVPCRVYDCRNDARIWTDFDSRTVNPKLNAPDWPHNLAAEEFRPERTA